MARRATFDVASTAWVSPAADAQRAPAIVPAPVVAVLRFALPRPMAAVVAVHDAHEREVRVLLTGEIAAGEHSLGWDGRDDADSPVPPGEYALRLRIGACVVTSRRVRVG